MQPVGSKPSVSVVSGLPPLGVTTVERAAAAVVPESLGRPVVATGVGDAATLGALPAPGEVSPAARPAFAIDAFRAVSDTTLAALPVADRASLLTGLEGEVDRFIAGAMPPNLDAIPPERTGVVVGALPRGQ